MEMFYSRPLSVICIDVTMKLFGIIYWACMVVVFSLWMISIIMESCSWKSQPYVLNGVNSLSIGVISAYIDTPDFEYVSVFNDCNSKFDDFTCSAIRLSQTVMLFVLLFPCIGVAFSTYITESMKTDELDRWQKYAGTIRYYLLPSHIIGMVFAWIQSEIVCPMYGKSMMDHLRGIGSPYIRSGGNISDMDCQKHTIISVFLTISIGALFMYGLLSVPYTRNKSNNNTERQHAAS